MEIKRISHGIITNSDEDVGKTLRDMLRLAIIGADDKRVISFTEKLTNTSDPVSRILGFV